MFEKIEKRKIRIPSCRINKETFSSLGEQLTGFSFQCFLSSNTSDIKTDDINSFAGSEWPSKINRIQIKASESDRIIDLTMNFGLNGKVVSAALISGNDPIWVQGMASQLLNLFKKDQCWYSPITEHLAIRLLISLGIVIFPIWKISYYLWQTVIEVNIGISEIQTFILMFLASTLFFYPLNLFIIWLFPHFEQSDSIQIKVRKVFLGLIVLLVGWILTEFFFPQLF